MEAFDGAEAIRRADALMADYDAVLARISLRPKLLLAALKKFEIHPVFLRFFALPTTILSRKSARYG